MKARRIKKGWTIGRRDSLIAAAWRLGRGGAGSLSPQFPPPPRISRGRAHGFNVRRVATCLMLHNGGMRCAAPALP